MKSLHIINNLYFRSKNKLFRLYQTIHGNLSLFVILTRYKTNSSLPKLALTKSKHSMPVRILVFRISYGGGKTKAMFDLAEILDNEGFDVTIVSLFLSIYGPKFDIPRNIKFEFVDNFMNKPTKEQIDIINDFKMKYGSAAILPNPDRLAKYLKNLEPSIVYLPNYDCEMYEVIEKNLPQECISILGDHNPRRVSAFVRQKNTFNVEAFLHDFRKSRGAKLADKRFWKAANTFDAFHMINEKALESTQKFTRRRILSIPNSFLLKENDTNFEKIFSSRTIIAIGRLVKDKNFDHLIRAFALIEDQFPQWNVELYGEGPAKDSLQKLIVDLCLTDRVKLMGFDPDVNDKLLQTAIHAAPSLHESFGLTLLDAMNLGIPVVAYKDHAGASLLLEASADKEFGFLCNSNKYTDYAETLRGIMQRIEDKDPKILDIISNAHDRSLNYSRKTVGHYWKSALEQLIKDKAAGKLDRTVFTESSWAHVSIGNTNSTDASNMTNSHSQTPRVLIDNVIQEICPNMTVKYGPFRGMKYPEKASVGSALFPKLLGSYEKELHNLIEKLCTTEYSCIVDIGCAEGYYAIGMALRIKDAKVYAFDTNQKATRLCEKMAKLNDVANKLNIGDFCDAKKLSSLDLGNRALIISDCEGYEKELFSPELINSTLIPHDILIETHDVYDIEITRILKERFQNTHTLEIIESIDDIQKVNKYQYPELKGYSRGQLKILLGERRRAIMEWFYLSSKQLN